MSEYLKSSKLMNGKACLVHRDNQADLQIHGANGFIIQLSETKFQAGIVNHKTYNKLNFSSERLEAPASKGEERWYAFTVNEFAQVYKSLRVPRSLAGQLQFAKRFSDPN